MKKITLAIAAGLVLISATAMDLGIEGQIYEPIEEDFRVMLMRNVAAHDWSTTQQNLKQSAQDYTKNLPSYYLPPATKTETVWRDVGVVTTEDIYLPWVDHATGSVFEPGKVLVAERGSYFNPIAHLPSAGIERLFIFDATDPTQLEFAKSMMVKDVTGLYFMTIAGDLGPIAKEMNRPLYHPTPTMLEKFNVTSVPSLIGFGKGQHAGHMAVTSFALPVRHEDVLSAWFGLPYEGYQPSAIPDLIPTERSVLNPMVHSTGSAAPQ